jgi:hypothetical protein
MPKSAPQHSNKNVIDIFTRKPLSELDDNPIIRIAAELDGLEILYSNANDQDKLFSVRLLAWGLRRNGEVVGLVPWLDKLVPCNDINDPLNGQWQGYYDEGVDELFFSAPVHKIVELETAVEYYDSADEIIQEIPDAIGTHAALSSERSHSIILKEVISWQLYYSGHLEAMLVNEDKKVTTPVLPGDDCLYPASTSCEFRYFFQHNIANKIKNKDPAAMAAISLLKNSS